MTICQHCDRLALHDDVPLCRDHLVAEYATADPTDLKDYIAVIEEREWRPGDPTILPEIPANAYPPDSTPLENRLHDVTGSSVVERLPDARPEMIVYGLGDDPA